MNEIKYIDLFAGVGGFSLGIQEANGLEVPRWFNGIEEGTNGDLGSINGAENRGSEEGPERNEGSGLLPTERESTSTSDRRTDEQFNSFPNEGASLDREKHRFTCIGFSEVDKYASAVYRKRFPGIKELGDITKIDAGALPDFDLLVGGFPCQAFSVAGRRGGFSDTRGTLFFDIARICAEKRPKHILLENVKGLLSHDSGRTFQTIIKVLTDIGYVLQWEVLNSKNFGVPQNRERVFITGCIAGSAGDRPEVFPLGEGYSELTASSVQSGVRGTQASIKVVGHSGTGGERGYIHDTKGIIGAVSATDYKQPKQILELSDNERSRNYANQKELCDRQAIFIQQDKGQPKKVKTCDIAHPVKATNQTNPTSGGSTFVDEEPYMIHNKYGGFSETEPRKFTKFSPTLRTPAGGGHIPDVVQKTRIRKLTPIECERLQGFPDDWTRLGLEESKEVGKLKEVPISNTQRYKCCGNAVTVNVITSIIRKMYRV